MPGQNLDPPFVIEPYPRPSNYYVGIITSSRPNDTVCLVYMRRGVDKEACFKECLSRAERVCATLNEEGYLPLLR